MRNERNIAGQTDSFLRTRQKVALVFLVCFGSMFHETTFGQDEAEIIAPFDIVVGLGGGNKSHFGNFGVTGNLYFNKHVSLKASAGVAAFNYGGGVVSVGPEASFLHTEKKFFSLGAMWCYTNDGFDLLGDDDSNDFVEYHTSNTKSARFFLGYTMFLDGVYLRFDVGYSHVLSNYSYYFTGPGTPSEQQHERIQNGLDSGWLAAVYINFQLPFSKATR